MLLGMARALRQLRGRHDVILANQSMTALPVAAAGGRARKHYYIQADESEYYAFEKGARARAAQAIAMLSYELPLRQVANGPLFMGYKRMRPSTWIPPGIDLDIFHRRAAAPDFRPGDSITIGMIGRREPAKGCMYVLEAFRALALRDASVRLKVAYGNLPQGWAHERAEVVVPHNDAELAAYYRSVDILVAPGIVQLGSAHYPVLEAMACGTPLITTGYIPATEENAWIVPVKDSDAIARAVQDVRAMRSVDRLHKLDRAHEAVRGFAWPAVAQRFLTEFSRP
ncbi:MAG: glycosyltransferase [Comamonadaceae bacterium]|nr:MAG: glycosyltransferase [Comamonadaceae bacterium]